MPAYDEVASTVAPPKPLVEWLGFRRMMLLESGSSALSLVLEALRGLGRTRVEQPVQLPGLGCWTLTSAVEATGSRPQYYDVDRRLSPISLSAQSPAVLIQPWGGTAILGNVVRPWPSSRVLDCTLSIFGSAVGQATPAEGFTAAIISLGQAKPLGLPGGGGLVLYDDPALHDEFRAILLHHYEGLSWARRTCRYVTADWQTAALNVQVEWLSESHRERISGVARVQEAVSAKTVLEPLVAPGDQDTPGITVVVPFLLPADYPLSAKEVHRVAMAERIPLITHPVTPPYLEPAGLDLSGDCPVAEDTARRLVLLPVSLSELGPVPPIARFLESLAAQPALYGYPYSVSAAPQATLPASLGGPGILGRRLDGSFVYRSQFTRRKYEVSAAVAAALMASSTQPI